MTFDPFGPTAGGEVPLLDFAAWYGALGALGAAMLLGAGLLPRLRGWSRGEAWLLRVAAGIGPVALLELFVGQFHGGLQWLPGGLLGLGGWFACGISLARERQKNLPRTASRAGSKRSKDAGEGPRPDRERIATGLGWGLVGLWLIALLGPAACPSIGYDVLEYHLGFVAHCLRTGEVQPIPHVFYSAQPLATEMFFLLAAGLGSVKDAAPGLLHWWLIVLCAAMWWRLSREWLPEAWRPATLLALLTGATLFGLQLDRLTDWTGVVMMTAGLWVAARERALLAADAGHSRRQGATALGLLAAGALAAKWTHAGTVVPALAVMAGWLGTTSAQATGSSTPRAKPCLTALGWFGGTLTLFFLPWSIWLWRVAGNPVAPFLADRFAGEAWTGEQLAFLLHTHGATAPWEAVYWSGLWRRLVVEVDRTPWPLLGLLSGVLWVAMKRRGMTTEPRLPVAGLTLALLVGLLLWGRLTQAADRFLAPLIPLCVVLAAQAALGFSEQRAMLRRAMTWTLLAVAAFSTLTKLAAVGVSGFWPHALGREDRPQYLKRQLGLTAELFLAVDRLPPEARVLAINEARGYYLSRPTDLATVFDRQPIREYLSASESAETLERRLAAAGYTHLLVNEFEEARLLAFHPPAALEADADFQRVRAQYGASDPAERFAAQRALVARWGGWAAFASEPLNRRDRYVYLTFLEQMRERTTWSAGDPESLAMWIARLGEE
jgi:hypothetical protein